MTVQIDAPLVRSLISRQFPQWSDLPVEPVAQSGWDNRTFHLGTDKLVRMPSADHYAAAVHKEQKWLPLLAPQLPLPIPEPLAKGVPDTRYPWHWSVYRWIDGNVASREQRIDLNRFASDLADFLLSLQACDTREGPTRKLRGGSLELYNPQFYEAIDRLAQQLDTQAAHHIWQQALAAPFEEASVWYHGDVAAGNLLVNNQRLSAVIDFGGLGVGDPACDTVIAWTFLSADSRATFRQRLGVSDAIWRRGRGWALWKGLIVVSGIIETNAIEAASAQYAIDQVISDWRAAP